MTTTMIQVEDSGGPWRTQWEPVVQRLRARLQHRM